MTHPVLSRIDWASSGDSSSISTGMIAGRRWWVMKDCASDGADRSGLEELEDMVVLVVVVAILSRGCGLDFMHVKV